MTQLEFIAICFIFLKMQLNKTKLLIHMLMHFLNSVPENTSSSEYPSSFSSTAKIKYKKEKKEYAPSFHTN